MSTTIATRHRTRTGLASVAIAALALVGCETATEPDLGDGAQIEERARLEPATQRPSIVPDGTVYRVYREGPPFGFDRDIASLEALGLVEETDFFIHPVSDIADGIPDGTDVVILTYHNGNATAINTLLDQVGVDNPSTAQDERTNTDFFGPLLQYLFFQGGTVYVNMAGQQGGLTYRPPFTLYNAPVPGNAPDPRTDASLTGATFVVPPAVTVPGAAGPDGALGTSDDHPVVLGPDGAPGTADDLDDGAIDATAGDVALGNLSDGVQLPTGADRLSVLASASFGSNQRAILAEYCALNGLVIVTRMTLGAEAHQPAGSGFSVLQRNVYARAGSAARAQLCADNAPPVADPDGPYTGVVGAPVTFNGTGSSDSDGDDLTFDWDFGDGASAADAGPTPTHTYTSAGTFEVTLTVSDGILSTSRSTATTTATITEPVVTNEPPTADPNGPYEALEGESITFDGTESSDPEDGPLTFDWDFGDGASAEDAGADPGHAYADDGTFTVSLTVTDPDDAEDTAETTATIANVAPTVDAGPDITLLSGQTFDLGATFSDPGVEDAPWSWTVDWDTGASTSGQSTDQTVAITPTSPQFFLPGTYTVVVSVTDKDNGVGSDELTVVVQPIPASIDIKPGSDPNSINVKDPNGGGKGKGKGKGKSNSSNGKVPVALLGAADFDATLADVGTITLGDGSDPDTPVAVKPNGQPFASTEDVNADGFMDLVLHFDRSELIANGDLTSGSTSLTLRGALPSGVVFEGNDSVNPVP